MLGSASPALLRQSAESLAGRIAYHELEGLSIREAGSGKLSRLWLRGGFPRSYLAKNDEESFEWRRWFIRTYLERDLRMSGTNIGSETMRRFWTMLTHYHAQVLNSSDIARSFGISDKTVRSYLDTLASTFMVKILQPWHENIGKRLVKAPKIFFSDTGLLHFFMGIRNMQELLDHPRSGASWEGFAMGEIISCLDAREDEIFFWRTHNGAELDLLIVRGKTRLGFEIKRSQSPGLTPSMRFALSDLKLSELFVIHSGREKYSLGDNVEAIPLPELEDSLKNYI